MKTDYIYRNTFLVGPKNGG